MARRSYDKQFKMAAVKLVLEDNMTVPDTINIQNTNHQLVTLRMMNLTPKGTNYKYKRYHQNCAKEGHANLLNQMFKANEKNKIWVGDITYIPTQKKTLYLAVFVDIYSRKVVGYGY